MTRSWDQADFFAVPLLTGDYGIGQIVETRDCPEGSVFVALSLRRGPSATLPALLTLDEIVALLFVTTDHLSDGTWPIPGFDTLPATETLLPFRTALRRAAAADPPGSAVIEPAIVEAFLNACHGLLDWDFFPDRMLFDRMLLKQGTRPAAAVVGRPPP
ncbi:MAG: hypothetical protein JJT81_14655 [Rubellimicrobium sp.]|nr:hypothetical protein [Rubellimicrobium sp.]